MRRLLVLLGVILACLSQTAFTKGSLDQLELQGPVKSYLFKRFSASQQAEKVGWIGRRDFDENGYMTYSCTFKPDGSVRSETRWQYTLGGPRILRIVQTGDNPSETIYRYDEVGRLMLAETSTANNARLLTYYDAAGKPTGVEIVRPDGFLQSRAVVIYTLDGRTSKSEEFDASGKSVSTREVVVTPEGRPLRIEISPAPGIGTAGISVVTTYEYDDRGLRVSELVEDSIGFMSDRRKFDHVEYDAHGNWTTVMVYEWVDEDGSTPGYQLRSTEIRSIIYFE